MARLKSQSRSAGPKEAMDVDGVENIVDAPEEEAKAATNGAAEGEEEQEEGDGDEEEEEEGEYEVESIVDHKMQNGKYIYLVSWKGYGPEHNTWEPEAHVDHAEEIVSLYWDTKPKTAIKSMGTGKKRGRSSAVAGCSSRAANGGRSSQKRKQEEEEDFAEDYEETHVDSMNKYEDVRDWEDLVASVDTIERGREDVLMIYLTMTGGEKVAQPADVVYRRCPQKVLKFYEAHLKWRLTV